MKKFLKILIFILVLLLVLAIVVMALSPKKCVIAQSNTIDAPAPMVYNLVNDFKKWESWSPWKDLDPNVINSYSSKTEGVGATWSWKGNEKVGEGTQKILESVKNEKIKTSLEFNNSDDVAYSNWTFEPDGNKTKVTWDFDGPEVPFVVKPINLFMKGALNDSYKKGLLQLKELAENRAKNKEYQGYKIKEISLPAKHYLTTRQEVKMSDIQQFYARNLPSLFGKANKGGVDMDGMPGGLFYKWDETNGTTDMAAAIPIKNATEINGVSTVTIPAGKAIQVDYYGPYEKSSDAHFAIDDYMKDYGIVNNVPIVEEYVTDPGEEKNPDKWLTKITYYIPE